MSITIKNIDGLILEKFSKEKLKAASVVAAKSMDKIKNRETKKFNSPVKGARFDKPYNRDYAKRQAKPLNSVNLRRNKPKSNSIEKTNVKVIGNVAVLSFNDSDKARIFNYHQTGTAKGGKKRVIYPETLDELPQEVLNDVKNFLLK